MSEYDSLSKSQQADAELQEFLMIEKQKAQVQAQVLIVTSKSARRVQCI